MSAYQIYTDGGSRGNPGSAACGFVVIKDDKQYYQQGKYLGQKTNNEAEYQGLIESLLWLQKQPSDNLRVDWRLDSKLVVEQVLGNWKIKEPRLKLLRQQVVDLLQQLFPHHNYSLTHVPRAQNALADTLVNQVLNEHSF